MRIGLLGGGVIARLFLEHARGDALGHAEVVAIAGRGEASRGKALAAEYGVRYGVGAQSLVDAGASEVRR
jgi:hypothetical protein